MIDGAEQMVDDSQTARRYRVEVGGWNVDDALQRITGTAQPQSGYC